MSRILILDTETTGFEADGDDRLVEIGAVEMIDRELTGNHYHQYINPQRDVPEEAAKVHGLTTERLKDEPIFKHVAQAFVDYITDGDMRTELVIHNAPFDVGFLNAELHRNGFKTPINELCDVTDTLVMARKKYPGQRATLDALAKRFGIGQHFDRTFHGALLDSQILAHVYLRMTGGQSSLAFATPESSEKLTENIATPSKPVSILAVPVSDDELAKHLAFYEA